MDAFGKILADRLKAQRLSAAAFARRVGVRAPYVFLVRAGKRPVPAKRIEAWADALGLAGRERERFIEEAWLTRAPEQVRALVERLRKQAARSRGT